MGFELFVARTDVIIAELVMIIVIFGLLHCLLLILDQRNQIIIGKVVDNPLLLAGDIDQLLADEAFGGIGRHEGPVLVVGEGEAVHAEGMVAVEMEEIEVGFVAFAAGLAFWRLVRLGFHYRL